MPPKKNSKPKGRPPAAVAVKSLVSLKGSEAFEQWFDGLVEHTRHANRIIVMRNALEDFAKANGYKPPIPKR